MGTSKKTIDVFTVKRKEFITPHYTRVLFHIPEKLVEPFTHVKEGSNNKMFIPPPGIDVVYFPNDMTTDASEESIAKVRTYTNRKIDLVNRELAIDFVLHGDCGIASTWAAQAKAGDIVGIGVKENERPLVRESNSYLIAGDHTALPVIGNILEQLPQKVEAEVLIEIYGKEDEIPLPSRAMTKIVWLHNPHPEKGSQLADFIKTLLIKKKQGETYLYLAAEYETVDKMRSYLKEELKWDNENFYAVAYWRSGALGNE